MSKIIQRLNIIEKTTMVIEPSKTKILLGWHLGPLQHQWQTKYVERGTLYAYISHNTAHITLRPVFVLANA